MFDLIELIQLTIIIHLDLDPMGAIIVGISAVYVFFKLTSMLFQDCRRCYHLLGPHHLHRI